MTEGRQITNRDDILRFVTGGKAVFTLVSKYTQNRYTFRVKRTGYKGHDEATFFVYVMFGPDNTLDYTYMGMIADNMYRQTKKSAVAATDIRHLSFAWFYKVLTENPDKLDQVEFWHEGRCACCGRRLTVPASIESGIGPECAKKF